MFSYFDCQILKKNAIEIDCPFKFKEIVKLNLKN